MEIIASGWIPVCLTTFVVMTFGSPVMVNDPVLPPAKGTSLELHMFAQKPNSNMKVQDTLIKEVEREPDTHTKQESHCTKHIATAEHLKIDADGNLDSDSDVVSHCDHNVDEEVVHRDDVTDTTTNTNTGKYQYAHEHQQMVKKAQKAMLDIEHNSADISRNKKLVKNMKTGELITNEGDRERTTIDLSESDAQSKTDNFEGAKHIHQGHVKSTDRHKTSTVYIHEKDPNNKIRAGDKDVDTTQYTDNYVNKHYRAKENTNRGVETNAMSTEDLEQEDRTTHQHATAAIHETPFHKFIVVDNQNEDETLGQYTYNVDKQSELRGKDGRLESLHENIKKTLDTDQALHTDKLSVKSISKDHPDTPLVVTLTSNIIDKDHYAVKEIAKKHKTIELPNGGTKTIREQVENENIYQMDATPPRK